MYLSRYLDQETAKGPFRSSSQAATCYYLSINHSKVVPCPRTQQANLSAYLYTIPFLCWTPSREAVNIDFEKSHLV